MENKSNIEYNEISKTRLFKETSLFPNIGIVKNPEFISIYQYLQDIKTGKNQYKEITEKIRKEPDKTRQTELKRKITKYVTLSAKCNYRFDFDKQPESIKNQYKNIDKLVYHTGILQIDIDNISSEYSNIWNRIINDKYILFAFKSITGTGIKAGLCIEEKPELHKDNFLKAEKYFNEVYGIQIDKQTKDLFRACFISYDKDLYINPESCIFDYEYISEPEPTQKPEKITVKTKKQDVSVFAKLRNPENAKYQEHINKTVYNTIDNCVNLIEKAEKGTKHFNRLKAGKTIGGYISGGLVSESEVIPILEKAVKNNTSLNLKTAFKDVLDSIEHGKKSPITSEMIINEYKDYIDRKKPRKTQIKPEKVLLSKIEFKNNEVILQYADKESGEIEEIKLPFCFWDEVVIGKRNILKINLTDLYIVLKKLGYKRIRTNKDTNKIENDILVKVSDNIVLEIDIKELRTFVLNGLLKLLPDKISENFNKKQLHEVLLKGINSYISLDKISDIDVDRPEFVRDTDDEAYFFFKNGFVVVSKAGIQRKDYAELKGYIWNSQVIDFEIEVIKDKYQIQTSQTDETELNKSPFFHFIRYVCSFKDNNEKYVLDEERYISLMCAIGYLLHNNYQTVYRKAVILTEANLANGAQGGSGKGITVSAIGKLRNVVTENGKNIDYSNDKFVFQSINRDTDVVSVSDIKANFPIDDMYSVITDGIPVEKKGKDKFQIPAEKAPKFVISTNYSIIDYDGSADRRMIEIELSTFFNKNNTPLHIFKEAFFENWNKEQWNVFYNTMFYYMQVYFMNNCKVPNYHSDTIITRKIINLIGSDLCKYFSEEIELNKEYTFSYMYDNFLINHDLTEKDFSKIRFKKNLTIYCELSKIKIIEVLKYDYNQVKHKFVTLTKE